MKNYYHYIFCLIICIFLCSSLSLKASNTPPPVIISEVFYDSPLNENNQIPGISHNGEFIELFNLTQKDINLHNWYIQDSNGTYNFPENIIIPARGMIIIAYLYPNSNFKLTDLFPKIDPVLANKCIFYQDRIILNNNGEEVSLFDDKFNLVDAMSYNHTTKYESNNYWDITAHNGDYVNNNVGTLVSLQRSQIHSSGDKILPLRTDYLTLEPTPLQNTVYSTSYPIFKNITLADGTTIFVEQDKGIGTIPGQFAVNPTGAATYNIPIDCPSGINGMQPNISLVYNSQSGDGILGWGWNISGISSITKGAKNIFSDDGISGINLFAKDKYLLNGNALIAINGEYGGSGTVYQTENTDFTRITSFADGNSSYPTSFVVETKTGITMEYSSLVFPRKSTNDQINPFPYQWLLTKIKDNNGNYVKYTYYNDPDYSQTVLQRIEYNINENGGNQGVTSIDFNYQFKSNKKKFYINGYYAEDARLLDNIVVKTGGQINRRYAFNTKKSNDKYFLTEINLYGLNNEKLVPTIIKWGDDNSIINVNGPAIYNPTSYLNEVTKRVFTSADMDGDGKSELIEIYHRDDYSYRSSNNWHMYQSSDYVKLYRFNKKENEPNFTTEPYKDISIGGSFAFKDFKSINSSCMPVSIMGNNKKTILSPSFNLIEGVSFVRFIDILARIPFDVKLNHSNTMPICAYGDINNDGIDELIMIEKVPLANQFTDEGMVIYLQKQELSSDYLTTPIEFHKENFDFPSLNAQFFNLLIPENLFIQDFDGDGLKDMIITTKLGAFAFKNMGGSKKENGIVHVSFSQLPQSLNINSEFSHIKVGDFNNDGLPDFLLNEHCNSNWYLVLNKGNFNFEYIACPNIRMVEENFTSTNDDKDNCIITDFNHDGKSDVIIVDVIYDKEKNWLHTNEWGNYNRTEITWYTSNGRSFDVYKTYTKKDEWFAYNTQTTVGDFDGDGREDLFSLQADLFNNTKQENIGFIHRSFNNNFAANQIKSITDGFGNKTEVTYQPLTYQKSSDNSDFYTPQNDARYPILDITAPLYCVKTVKDPLGSITAYSYNGAKVQTNGRGFLGFKSQMVSNNFTNTKSISSTEWDYTLCLPTKQINSVVSTIDNKEISHTENFISNTKTGKTFLSLPAKTVTTDNFTGIVKSTEYISYDSFGNPRIITTTQGGATETQNINYIRSGAWCDNKPSYTLVRKTYNGDTHTRRIEYEYDAKGNLTKQTTDPSDVNQITTTYSNFDIFGHANSVSVSANGSTRTSTTTYHPSGKFIVSSKNILDETTTYNWNETLGLLNSTTDHWGKTTSYTYDNWGKLKETHYPDGNIKSSTLKWTDVDENTKGLYFSYTVASGSAPVWTYYDALGRETMSKTLGLNAKPIYVATEYDNKGRKWRISEPAFSATPNTWAATYEYDGYGRPSTITTPMGATSTAYNGKSVTVTSPESVKTTTITDAGLTQSVTTNGKRVDYTYYASGLTKTTTPEGGQPLAMEYDQQGNRTKLSDPDAGIVESKFNGFGELLEEKQIIHKNQPEIVTKNSYDNNGILQNINRNGEITNYTYDADLGYKSRIKSIEISGKHKQSFTYDGFSRVIALKEEMDGKTWVIAKEYNSLGQVSKEIYPSGYYTVNSYDAYGNLTEVTDKNGKNIWKAIDENARGQLLNVKRGNKTTTYQYDNRGFTTAIVADGIQNTAYNFDTKGNLEYRTDIITNQKEAFTYDALNRLTNWDIYQNNALVKQNGLTYNSSTSNIETKSDIVSGASLAMSYGENGKPHALTSISGVPGNIPTVRMDITYTDFKKVKTITEGNKYYELTYGIDDQRRKSLYKIDNVDKLAKYYLSNYEEEINSSGNVRKIHYLSGGAILIQNGGVDSLLYAYSDYQGSLVALTDESGNVIRKFAYDPWGKRRDADNWTLADNGVNLIIARGYTGHEHLEAFCIINMNGRVYDPLTASFFSPDPYVQAPDNWLNYNRYAYAYGNPFKYIDPKGEWIWIVVGAVVGGVINVVAHGDQIHSFWDGVAAFGIGAAGGALAVATGGAAFGVGGFWGGALSAGVGYIYGTTLTTLGNTGYFGDPLPTAKQFLTGLGIAMATGGLIKGVTDKVAGKNFWDGSVPRPTAPIEPLPTPELKPLQTNNVSTPQIKSPDVTDFNYDANNVKYTVTTESGNANLSTSTSDGLSLKIERPDIKGYVPQIEGKTDLFHTFPSDFDRQIVKEGVATFNNGYKDFSFTYKAPGTIVTTTKTYNGMYEIGVRIRDGFVIHKVFRPF